MDNLNVVGTCKKGSPIPRLQAYARLIFEMCKDNNINLSSVWIPRHLNMLADFLSEEIDFEDCQVTVHFFQTVYNDINSYPEVDLFADHKNAEAPLFLVYHTAQALRELMLLL
jgi:hypothetical protein